MAADSAKVSLPAFLKMLTSNSVSASKAMAIAGKIYKTFNTSTALAELTDFQLQDAGITDAEERKLVLNAVRKAGYKSGTAKNPSTSAQRSTPASTISPSSSRNSSSLVSGSQKHVGTATDAGESRRKRKRNDKCNEFLPDRPTDELEEQAYGSLEFNEVLDETVLQTKHAVVNRAPIMTAWSFIIAERLGFTREEALSIASVYTEMNAISKGVSIGIYSKDKKDGVEADKGGSQPYVDLMGRRPLFQMQDESWRALSSDTPVSPASGFSYISRSLRQTAPFIVGALRLLADAYTPDELNKHGFSLYTEFRPEVKGWGGRGEVRCEKILQLRKWENGGLKLYQQQTQPEASEVRKLDNKGPSTSAVVECKGADKIDNGPRVPDGDAVVGPHLKKPRTMTVEEYEAALDEDDTFADVNLDFPEIENSM
ncbi:hypothetical protein BDY19DRAFT_990766 [Irpex rosettiformis]|uniref:Uncharacterized protein n=1 Tax=Irpex rosettiformis TaxID=378272 RepID=A0ACB8UCR6_9APHY|nr:hypothetical protein BDY19DRAFT_990766 [Irpex rosettiformis]